MLISEEDEAFLREMHQSFGQTRGQYASLLEIAETARRGEMLSAQQATFVAEVEKLGSDRPRGTYARFVRIINALRRTDFDARLTRIEEALRKAGLL